MGFNLIYLTFLRSENFIKCWSKVSLNVKMGQIIYILAEKWAYDEITNLKRQTGRISGDFPMKNTVKS